MKSFFLRILLVSLLLGAVQHFYGATSSAISTSKKAITQTFKPSETTSTSLDLTEFDLEEDHQLGDDFHEDADRSQVFIFPTSLEKWWPIVDAAWVETLILKPQQIGPHFGYTTPIYLSHRVLRI